MSKAEGGREAAPQSRVVRIAQKVRADAVARVRIGVAGNGGSFSEQAGIRFATERYERDRTAGRGEESLFAVVEIVWLITTEAVMNALEAKTVDYGVFAVMNNHGGAVRENLGAVLEHMASPARAPDGLPELVTLPVKHVLMMRPKKGISLRRRPKYILTQLQAYEQCKKNLAKRYPGAIIDHGYPDTATAAKHLADGTLASRLPPGITLDDVAVVGPETCATLNGLAVKRREMQDHPDNKTTFAVAVPYEAPSQNA